MGRLSSLALIALAMFLQAGCVRQSRAVDSAPEVSVMVSIEPMPPAVGKARVQLVFKGPDGAALSPVGVTIRGDMSHPGMIPVLATPHPERDGTYTTELEWTMAGDWILTVEAELADGRSLIRTFKISVGEPAP